MKFDLEKAIKYPFSDVNWKKKTLVYILLFAGMQLLLVVFQFGLNIFSALSEFISAGSNTPAAGGLFYIFGSLLMLFLIPFLFIATIYRSGYVVEVIKSRYEGKEEIPSLKPVGQKFKNWLHMLAITFPPMFGAMLIIGLLMAFFIVLMVMSAATETAVGIILAMIMMLFMIPVMIISYISIFFVIASMFYLYLKNGSSVSAAYNWSEIISTAKKHWLTYLKMFGLSIAFGFGIGMVTLLSWIVLLGWLVGPVLMILQDFYMGYIVGEGFKSMKLEDSTGEISNAEQVTPELKSETIN